jgi:hypothetical protein
MNLQLKKFDMNWIKDDSVVVFIGKRNTGKSFLVRDFLYYKRHFPIGTVISGTEKQSGFYGKICPSIFIHHEFSSDLVANVSKRQTKVISAQRLDVKNSVPYDFEWKDRQKVGSSNSDIEYVTQRKPCWIDKTEYESCVDKIAEIMDERDNQYYVKWRNESIPANIDARAFLLLDDCLYDDSWTKDISIKEFFMNGRHKDLLFIITMQYALGIRPLLRSNIDYVFILRDPYVKNRKTLYENYAGVFPTFDVFCQVMDQCTENYECLVVNLNCKSNKLEDQVFWYKAADHEDFKIGAKEYWDYHYEHFVEQELDTGEEEDNIMGAAKKNKPKINVKRLS